MTGALEDFKLHGPSLAAALCHHLLAFLTEKA